MARPEGTLNKERRDFYGHGGPRAREGSPTTAQGTAQKWEPLQSRRCSLFQRSDCKVSGLSAAFPSTVHAALPRAGGPRGHRRQEHSTAQGLSVFSDSDPCHQASRGTDTQGRTQPVCNKWHHQVVFPIQLNIRWTSQEPTKVVTIEQFASPREPRGPV